ncbi:hypothetical protein BCON_0301g00020 [Botryotinia convoluta]|uniref:Uncharacterized protein n=1 Tax=Botryotinia convoluta TaxID=54673 RepID=A0A4Z1HCM2_9HELO|nr:hypothetical protein BCON_0301g00020 [Botryotinia convoluta]
MQYPPLPDLLPYYREQPQYPNKNLEHKKSQNCRIRIRALPPVIPSFKTPRCPNKTARDVLNSWNDHTNDPDYYDDDFEYFVDELEDLEKISADVINGPDLKQRATEFKPEDSILERLPTELREMIFIFCGRNTFCSADQGPRLLKALRGQRRAYTHALAIFERLNSYELGAELRNHTSEICHKVHDMTGLMTVNKAPRNVSSQSNSNDSELAESDLKLTLQSVNASPARDSGRIHENLKYYGDFTASTPSTVLYDLVRQLHSANHIRDVQFSQELSLTRERSSRIILCQNDQGDWTFLKNFLTLVPCRRFKRVIIQLPNPENYRVNAASRYDIYYRDNHYESYRAKQDAFVLAVIESINQKVGVRGVVLGRSKDSLSGFCIWEAPEGRYMDWHRDVIEPWALRGGFGKTFLDYENNFFELRESTSRSCFVYVFIDVFFACYGNSRRKEDANMCYERQD